MSSRKKSTQSNVIEAIILAAGLGTRMKSKLPKVLHPVCGVPMLELLLTQLDQAFTESGLQARFHIVVGHGRDLVMSHVNQLVEGRFIKTPVVYTVQQEQKGTGHAVILALENPETRSPHYNEGIVAIFNGDLPLFTPASFHELLKSHQDHNSAATLSSMVLSDPGAYGRVVRRGRSFESVVEFKDANLKQRQIQEVNGGVYLFDRKTLTKCIAHIGNKNKTGEYYLPRVFELARKSRQKILAHPLSDSQSLWGVNNLIELSQAQKHLYRRVADRLMTDGVSFLDPDATYVGPYVSMGQGCRVGPGTIIDGRTRIGDDVSIGAHCYLKNMHVASGAIIKQGTYAESSEVGPGTSVGPMAHLRPGSILGADVKIGNFVEVKESTIGSKTAVSHLSYVGDAQVGERVNIGCGFVTCNYDGQVREGRRKHRSLIGNDVFIGSDSQVVAPITLADGTYVASGSTVTESVKEPHSLVVARTRQVTKPGYARKYKK